ncbi:Transcription factor iib [Globisporangium polare]
MVLAPHFQAPRPSTSAFASSPELRPVQRSSASTEFKTNKEVHRRAILAEIQQKLDILSDDDELEAERNTKMFLQRTSIALDSPPLLPVDEPHHFGDLLQHDDSEEKQESGNNLQRHRVRSSGPSLKKKSSFAFADGSDSDDVDDGGGDGTNKLEMKKRITKLFDFESLLQDSPTNAKPQGEKVTSTFNREQQLQKSSSLLLSSAGLSMKDHDLKPDIFARQMRIALALSEDEEDQALAQMLIAKRNARRRQQQDHKSPEKQTQLTKSLEVSRSSQSDQRSRSDLVKLSVGDLTHQEDDQEEELNGMSEIQFAAERSRIEEHTAVNRNDGHDGEGGSEEVEDEENLSIDL